MKEKNERERKNIKFNDWEQFLSILHLTIFREREGERESLTTDNIFLSIHLDISQIDNHPQYTNAPKT